MPNHFSCHNSQHSYGNNTFEEGNDKYNWSLLARNYFWRRVQPCCLWVDPRWPIDCQ